MADPLVDDLKHALGDAYTIERELMGGGMSRVFVAREHALGREVVIKVLPPELAAGVNRERFRREVQLAARLSHPYIVPLLHAGELGSLLWFTMPYIPGESLRTRIQRDGAFTLPEVLRLLRDVVEALAYAHSRGVIHRDIKPGNILSDGQHALVTDFGVAKALNAALPLGGPGHTTSGMAIGTPAYMAPEQLAADPDADHRVDIYAVGLLAYEMLTGESPFAAASPTATMTAQLTRMPPPLHEVKRDVPEAFSRLVQQCLAKAPDERPPEAQAVLLELDRVIGAIAADQHRSVSGENAAMKRASAVPLVMAVAAVLALVAGGFWYTGRQSSRAAADSARARVGGDSEVGASLPPHVMTHQDSINIAQALRDQLNQLDPKQRTRVDTVRIDSIPLDVIVHRTDSLVQARLAQLSEAQGEAPLSPLAPRAAVPPGVVTVSPPMSLQPAQHKLGILVPPSRDSSAHETMVEVARELSAQLLQINAYQSIALDTAGFRRDHGPQLGGADVLVFLALQRTDGDSTQLRISLRSNDPRTGSSFNVISSVPVARVTSARQFSRTIRDAVRTLSRIGRTPLGQPWPANISVGTQSLNLPPGTYTEFRGLNLRSLDSLRVRAESLKRRTYGRPRDSL